jgi:hypothetical protein
MPEPADPNVAKRQVFVWMCREPSVTTSVNPWAPPGEPGDDAVLERLEMMIEPSFDDIDLPRPAEAGAELPWLSGGTVTGIEPDFDATGLPAPAAPGALHGSAAAQLEAPAASGPDVGPPAYVPARDPSDTPMPTAGTATPFGPPPGALAPLAPPASGAFAPPAASAAVAGVVDPQGKAESRPGDPSAERREIAEPDTASSDDAAAAPPAADWAAPDPASMPSVQLPSPMAVRAALEQSKQRRATQPTRKRTPLHIALALAGGVAVIALVAAITMVLSGDDDGFVPVAVVPAAPSGEVVEEGSIPLVLPSFTPVERAWNSIDVRYENTTEVSTTVLTLSGPADQSVMSVVSTIQPIDLTVAPASEEILLTPKFAFTLGTQGWVRTPADEVGARDLYGRMLAPRTFEMVVPSQMRPLVTVTAIEELGGAGLRRYTLELRAESFATQYPAVAEQWSELNAWSEPLPERTELVVDVDDTGLVVSSTITTLDGVVIVGSALSNESSAVVVPTEFSRGGAPS